MKKKNLKNLKLNKKSISNLTTNELKGGTRTSNLCTVFCTLDCPPPPETFTCDYTQNSDCRCL